MKGKNLLIAAALLSALLLLSTGLSAAFLTDVETRNNVITIGRVKVALDEGGFVPDKVVVPGTKSVKAPKLTNTGNKDEFVFIKLTVPKRAVTLLHEETSGADLKGTPRAEKADKELFRTLCDDTPNTAKASGEFDSDITYHAGADGTAGWLLLKTDTSDPVDDVYVFGYNRKLTPAQETVTLFDKVQLKSFIDGEFYGETEIGAACFAIQADNLKPAITFDPDADYQGADALRAILVIVENKLAA